MSYQVPMVFGMRLLQTAKSQAEDTSKNGGNAGGNENTEATDCATN